MADSNTGNKRVSYVQVARAIRGGAAAHVLGKPESANPYPEGTQLRDLWTTGWRTGNATKESDES